MKIKFAVWVCVLGSILLFTQCKKDKDEYRINGKVLNARTGGGLSGANVAVQKQSVTGGTYSAAFNNAASTVTDGNGNFDMQFQRENFGALRLKVNYPQFIGIERNLNLNQFQVGSIYTEQVALYPEAFVDVHFAPAALTSTSGGISFTFVNAYFDCVCCNNGFKSISQGLDTTFSCKLYGDQWLKYKTIFHKSTTDSVAMDSVWCNAFHHTAINILY